MGSFHCQQVALELWFKREESYCHEKEGVLHYTMASAMKFELPFFDEKGNFTMWHCTIKDILVQQGLDVALEEEKLAEMRDSEWKSIMRKGTSTIRLALTPTIKYILLNETTPMEMWKKFEEIYVSKSLTNSLSLKIDLYTLRMEEGDNLHDHINEFNQLVCQLLSVGKKLSDEEQAIALLASLPQSYRSLVRSLLIGKNTIKLDDVTIVLQEDQRMYRDDHISDGGRILAWRVLEEEGIVLDGEVDNKESLH